MDDQGNQVGVLELQEALRRAQEAGLDLVEVAPEAKPPVARIMDYSRFKYEQEKKEREARKKQHTIHIKEVKVGPKIEDHDYKVKLNQVEKFLTRGDKVKVTMMFRGREMMHMDLGKSVINRLATDAAAFGEVEFEPKLEGRILILALRPKK